jgi:hypothetical protein
MGGVSDHETPDLAPEATCADGGHVSPWFDQEPPEHPIAGLVALLDISPSWELDAMAVFRVAGRGYLVVHVRGCSCWPLYGATVQMYAPTVTEAERAIRRLWDEDADAKAAAAELVLRCQSARWRITRPIASGGAST